MTANAWDQTPITYSFPVDTINGSGSWTGELPSGGKTVARYIYDTYLPAIVNQTFSELTETLGEAWSGSCMRLMQWGDDTGTTIGWTTSGNRVFINSSYSAFAFGSYINKALWHEIGHAMGLKHAHQADISPFNVVCTSPYDATNNTIMAYREFEGDSDISSTSFETYGRPQTFNWMDVLALQYKYGAATRSAGNTVHSWSSSTGAYSINGVSQWSPGANRVNMTLWKYTTGYNRIDLSNYTTPASIDLRNPSIANPDYGWIVFDTTSNAQIANNGQSEEPPYNVTVCPTVGWVIDQVKPGSDDNVIVFHPDGAANTLILTGDRADYTVSGSGRDWVITKTSDSKENDCTNLDFVTFADEADVPVSEFGANPWIAGGTILWAS